MTGSPAGVASTSTRPNRLGFNWPVSALICTVGLNPTPVALAVLTSTPIPNDVLLVCSTASQTVGDRLIDVLAALVPHTVFRSLQVGSGVSWRATYAAMADKMPDSPYRLDYTGGTTSMTMAAVKIHLEEHHSAVDGGASLRSYIDEQSGEQVCDSGTATAVDTAVLTIAVLASLHDVDVSLGAVLRTSELVYVRDKQRAASFVEATRSAVQAQTITEQWTAAWSSIGLGEVFARLRPPPDAKKSTREGTFVELVSLAAAIASGCCDEIAFDVHASDDAQFDVIVRSGHRVVCIESKKGYLDARDDLGHRMNSGLHVFGSAARVQIHVLANADKRPFLAAYDVEIDSWKRSMPELDRVHLIHTFSAPSSAGNRRIPASRSAMRQTDPRTLGNESNADPFGAMIERLRLDLPAPSSAIGRGPVLDRISPPPVQPVFGTVMIAIGGSPLLTGLILDNETRTLQVVGPRQTVRRVTTGSAVELVDTENLSARAVWQAAWAKQPEAVLPTPSKKSAAAGLLRYAHESGAAIEHLLPRGVREFGNGSIASLNVPPRWQHLLTESERGRGAPGLPGPYQPYSGDGTYWQGTDSLIECDVLLDLAARWSDVDGVEVFVSTDIGMRAVAPVIITHHFVAFAVGSPFRGKDVKWPLARSLTAIQATVLNNRFGPAVRTWVAVTDRAQGTSDAGQREKWNALWVRLHVLSGIDEKHAPIAPWTAADLDEDIARFLGSARPV